MNRQTRLGYHVYVFSCGVAVMLLEFAASRLLAPYFGSSIFVWGNIVGVVLMALSLGYYIGGRLADRDPRLARISRYVLWASVITCLIPVILSALVYPISLLQITVSMRLLFSIVGSFGVIILLFAIPIFLLGMVSPFLIRLATTDLAQAGQTAGALYAWSTLGSIVGTFASAFFIVPLFGSRFTIYLAAAMLAVVGAWGMQRWQYYGLLLLPLTLGLWFHGSPLRADAVMVTEGESLYQYYAVTQEPDRLLLQYNEGLGTQSYYMLDGVLTGYYYDDLALAPILRPDASTVAVLGLAGGTLTRQLTDFYPQLAITGVELDPQIVAVAKKYFALDEQPITITIDDGRNFIRASSAQYDLIFIDVYTNEYYIPWHLTTQQFFQELADHQPTDGLVAMNVGSSGVETKLFQAILGTLQSVYPYTYYSHVPDSFNYVVFASRAPIDPSVLDTVVDERTMIAQDLQRTWTAFQPAGQPTILTDDRAPVELYTESMIWDYLKSL